MDRVDVPDRDAREMPVREQFGDGKVTRAHKSSSPYGRTLFADSRDVQEPGVMPAITGPRRSRR
ncbi:hypothetical protein [Streptomyces sp. NPDC051776]|uniref:hypothetical protein n=1 Tax=Streptomyces sp. NPDC051776 TaxID=3155414 RepID=UPI00342B479A